MKSTKIIVIILLILAVLLLTMTFLNSKENKNDALNANGITVSIETSDFAIDKESKKIVLKDEKEIKQIIQIINSLEFSKETCDGLNSYILTINENEKYGIEAYNNYHITSSSKGEAKLTDEQTNIIKEIISKYF